MAASAASARAESAGPFWWLSFRAPGPKRGRSVLIGAAVVGPASDLSAARKVGRALARATGIKGGKVAGHELPAHVLKLIDPQARGALMPREDALALSRRISAAMVKTQATAAPASASRAEPSKVEAERASPELLNAPRRAVLSSADFSHLEWQFSVAPSRFERSTSQGIHDSVESSSPWEIMKAGYEYGRPTREKVYSGDAVRNEGGELVRDGHGNVVRETVIGHRDALSARPTAELVLPSGFTPDSVASRRFAWISRALRTLPIDVSGVRLADVLGAYFGARGNHWAQLSVQGGQHVMIEAKEADGTLGDRAERTYPRGFRPVENAGNPYATHAAHGRIGAVYVLTRGGALVLEHIESEAKRKGQPDYGFGTDLRLQLEVSNGRNEERRALLARANREARALFVTACIEWNKAQQLVAEERDAWEKARDHEAWERLRER